MDMSPRVGVTTVRDVGIASEAAYKATGNKINNVLFARNSHLTYVAHTEIGYTRYVLFYNPTTSEYGVAAEGTNKLIHWLQNVKYWCKGKKPPRSLIKEVKMAVLQFEAQHGMQITWFAAHSKGAVVLSRVKPGHKVWKIFVNGAMIKLDGDTVSVRMIGDIVTEQLGQAGDSIILTENGGGHGVSTWVDHMTDDLTLEDLMNRIGLGNQKKLWFPAGDPREIDTSTSPAESAPMGETEAAEPPVTASPLTIDVAFPDPLELALSNGLSSGLFSIVIRWIGYAWETATSEKKQTRDEHAINLGKHAAWGTAEGVEAGAVVGMGQALANAMEIGGDCSAPALAAYSAGKALGTPHAKTNVARSAKKMLIQDAEFSTAISEKASAVAVNVCQSSPFSIHDKPAGFWF